jgi:hypothetical protein
MKKYHKFPKKFGKQETYILTRMAKLRNNLIISKERELKVRQEKINKQKLTGLDKAFKELIPFLIKPQKVTKILDEDKKKTRKKESDYVKGIPVFNKVVKRKDQEKMKNLLVDGIAEKEDFANK